MSSLVCALLFLTSATLSAQSNDNEQRSWDLGIALGYGERTNPLINSEDIDINSVITFSWYGDRLFFDNGDLGFTLATHRNYSLNLIATVNNERNFYNYLTGKDLGLSNLINTGDNLGITSAGQGGEQVKNPKPEDLQNLPQDVTELTSTGANADTTDLAKRDYALNSGVEFLYIGRFGDIQSQVLTDISSTHGGQEAWLSWSYPWFTRNSEFALTLGMEWKSRDLVGYYYGVTPEEASPATGVYQGSSGTNHFIRFSARHSFNEHWHLVTVLEKEYLSNAIRQSPIVDKKTVDTFFTGLIYQF